MKLLSVAILFHLEVFYCYSFINSHSPIRVEKYEGDPGKPLILTPSIRQGLIQQAQSAAEVILPGLESVKSYAGYLTVDDQYDSNLFFWFFPSQSDYANDPVVLWLQGGPGVSSLVGLFLENGPFLLTDDQTLKLRSTSWTQNHSVLYIDNPVGTGYSFTSRGGYSKNQTAVGANLYNALLQFFQLFPKLQKNDFFITGESYAGKYVPAVAYTIYKNNPSAKQKINLQGLAMGNGYSDPEHQVGYAEYLYQIGLIDTNSKIYMQQQEEKIVELLKNRQWLEAKKVIDELIAGENSYFQNITGFSNYFNYLIENDTSESLQILNKVIQYTKVRQIIHVGDVPYEMESHTVYLNLITDFMQSVASWVSELLSHYRVLIYTGQLDIIVAYPLTVNYLKQLNFSAANEYKTATRHQWYVGESLAGYVKQAGNLTEVLVRNAGHLVPADQPERALDLITRFTRNKPFY